MKFQKKNGGGRVGGGAGGGGQGRCGCGCEWRSEVFVTIPKKKNIIFFLFFFFFFGGEGSMGDRRVGGSG